MLSTVAAPVAADACAGAVDDAELAVGGAPEDAIGCWTACGRSCTELVEGVPVAAGYKSGGTRW